MILGISYQKHYPEHIHSLPNGLTIFKSKFKPTSRGALACIGGPVEALSFLCDSAGTEDTMTYLSYLAENMKTYKFRMDFFPSTIKQSSCLVDSDIPGICDFIDKETDETGEEALETIDDVCEEVTNEETMKQKDGVVDSSCDEEPENSAEKIEVEAEVHEQFEQSYEETDDVDGIVNVSTVEIQDIEVMKCSICDEVPDIDKHSNLVQSEMEKFLKLQDSGLDMTYKCPKCRRCSDCLKGAGQEKLSMQQEAEQEVIKDSVKINIPEGKATASLAFTADPDKLLADNEYIAIKRLKNVCMKYSKTPGLNEAIYKGFKKLIDRGHIIPLSQLTPAQRDAIDMAPTGYTIPWDVGFKETSVSTPARPTFDASSKTSSGYSLNDCLAKGNASLIDLVSMVLNWMIGSHAVAGDISQFYNTVELDDG